jgi:zinc finger SWIM domain-containing protein 3
MFNSEDEGFQFYKNYTYEKGFSVRKVYCEWDKDMDERNLCKFILQSEGFRTHKHLRREIKLRRSRNVTRFGCHAKFVIAMDCDTKQWYVKDFINEHNHPMIPPDLSFFFCSHGKITDEQKAEIMHMQVF